MTEGARTDIALLAAAVLAAYFNSLWGAFQFDDYKVIVNNGSVHSLAAWYADAASGGIRPLLKLTYALNWMSGAGIWGFHLFNMSVHALNAVLVYVLSGRLARRWTHEEGIARWAAFTAAMLFALHPVQTESVTYVSSRSTSLMSSCYLAAIISYDYGRESGKRYWLYGVSPALFLAAVAVKEVALTLPAALALLELSCKSGKDDRLARAALRQALHWAILAAAVVLLFVFSRYQGLLIFSIGSRSISANLLSQVNGITYLLSRLVLVTGLNIDPDMPVITAWSPAVAAESVFLLSIPALGLLAWRSRPWAGFASLWFFLHLLPTNSVIPRLDVANERQLYLAVWPVFLALAMELSSVRTAHPRIRARLRAALAALLILLGAFTAARNHVYRSETSLWEDTASKSPLKARAFNNLGYAYFNEMRYDDALRAYATALRLRPDYALARNNLAETLKKTSRKR